MNPWLQIALKVSLSAVIILVITEVAKRSTWVAALIASLPLISIVSFIWIWLETRDLPRLANMSTGIFWLVIPSQLLFLGLPWLIRHGYGFWTSLSGAIVATLLAYFLMLWILRLLHVQF